MPDTNKTVWIFEYFHKASEASKISIGFLAKELEGRGLEPKLIDPAYMDIVADASGINWIYEGQSLSLPACVVPRTGSSSDARLLGILMALQALNVPLINTPQAITIATDKSLTMLVLAAAGLSVPQTLLPAKDTSSASIVEKIGAPTVVKRVAASKGEGVFLLSDKRSLDGCLRAIQSYGEGEDILFQRFIEASSGRDARVIIIDGKLARSFSRTSFVEGEFRANLALGGTGGDYPVPPDVEELCLKATAALGLDIAGIDILFGENGEHLICEINSSPFMNAEILVDESKGVQLPKLIVDLVLKRMKAD